MSPLFAFKVVCCDPGSCATWWPLDVWHNLEQDKDKYEFHPTHANGRDKYEFSPQQMWFGWTVM